MKISERFYSVQGEGKLAGVPSVFIRVSGCNLRCVWCDTPYASWNPEGGEQTVEELVGYVRSHGSARHVVLTGGEPMIMPEIVPLSKELKGLGYHVTVETAGTYFREVAADLMSISPKLSNSTPWEAHVAATGAARESAKFVQVHEKQRLNLPVLRKLMALAPEHQLKFVVSRRSELAEIDALLGELAPFVPSDVLLMPEGVTVEALGQKTAWLSEVCKERGFRYCPRLHIELYGNRRGT